MSPVLELYLIFLLYILLHSLSMNISMKGTEYILNGLNIIAGKKPHQTTHHSSRNKEIIFQKNV